MDKGKYVATEECSAQGNIISPVLANIYMHFVLVLWEKIMNKRIYELKGANMDIDLIGEVGWKQMSCPWNKKENTKEHKCAVKGTSICKYFCGIKYLDSVLCSYPYENLDVLGKDEIDRKIM